MTVENLLRSIAVGYMHFNRVNSYKDFHEADAHDGEQLPRDRPGNEGTKFELAPEVSGADYYDQCRSRTYACCFSLKNSEHIWESYANDSKRGKVCVVFDFSKLRTSLNQTLQPANAALEYNGKRCRQVFSLNYGIVEYVEWDRYQANAEHLPTPIKYTYLKNRKFSDERELRVSLSAPGIGQFVMDGSVMDFRAGLQIHFDFKAAFADGTIQALLYAPDYDTGFLHAELLKMRIVPSDGGFGKQRC